MVIPSLPIRQEVLKLFVGLQPLQAGLLMQMVCIDALEDGIEDFCFFEFWPGFPETPGLWTMPHPKKKGFSTFNVVQDHRDALERVSELRSSAGIISGFRRRAKAMRKKGKR